MEQVQIISDKIYRKLHTIFWQKLRPGRWSLYLYPAYRHYRKHRLDTAQEPQTGHLYLTQAPNRGAGIGHQLGNWNSGYHFAQLFGVSYAYSPFSNPQWDSFLGFGEGEVSAEELRRRGYRKHRLPYFSEKKAEDVELIRSIIYSYSGQKVVFYTELDQFYEKQYEIMDALRDKFNHAPARAQDKLIYQHSCLNIAVHIRRGDIVAGQTTQDPALTKRWLATQYYADILEALETILDRNKIRYQIYLFSQGTKEDFPELQDIANLTYCLDMPPRDSFLHMVRADVLITSKSSFSYKPALLAEGLRICPAHFWHGYPDNGDWILVDEELGMNEGQRDRLEHLLIGKKNEKN